MDLCPIRVRNLLRSTSTDDHQSDAGGAGIFSQRTNRTQAARVCSHHGPIGRRNRRYTLTADQSDTRSEEARVYSHDGRTNRTQAAWIYSHEGPIRRRKRGYILTRDQSDAGSADIFSRGTNRMHRTCLTVITSSSPSNSSTACCWKSWFFTAAANAW
eukprot:7897951-Pyramimonas_sp.AAC.1